MINFHMAGFWMALEFLTQELGRAQICSRTIRGPVPDGEHQRIKSNMEVVFVEVARLKMIEVQPSCVELEDMFQCWSYHKYSYQKLEPILERMYKDFKRCAMQQHFFHYPEATAELALAVATGSDQGWKIIIDAFPMAGRETQASIDCYAMDDYSGCIFHITRVAELGLRRIAKERGVKAVRNDKPIEYAMWGEVIAALQIKIEELRTAKGNKKKLTLKRRDAREKAVEFYSTIMADMQALLPLRDRNSHFRGTYDRGQAFDAMNRMKQMMGMMATKLGESGPDKIAWGL